MSSFTKKLVKTRGVLTREGSALLTRTRTAAVVFARETQDAGRSFTAQLVRQARDWRSYGGSLGAEVLQGPAARRAAQGAQRGALVSVLRALEHLQALVRRQLVSLDAVPSEPLTSYQQLTARQIVSRLGRLDEAQCRQVQAFEQQHKRRSTVLRAVQQRLAA